MRTFNVLVTAKSKLTGRTQKFHYPKCEGSQALRLMRTLKMKGHEAIAFTCSFGIEETLTLEEMEAVIISTDHK